MQTSNYYHLSGKPAIYEEFFASIPFKRQRCWENLSNPKSHLGNKISNFVAAIFYGLLTIPFGITSVIINRIYREEIPPEFFSEEYRLWKEIIVSEPVTIPENKIYREDVIEYYQNAFITNLIQSRILAEQNQRRRIYVIALYPTSHGLFKGDESRTSHFRNAALISNDLFIFVASNKDLSHAKPSFAAWTADLNGESTAKKQEILESKVKEGLGDAIQDSNLPTIRFMEWDLKKIPDSIVLTITSAQEDEAPPDVQIIE